MYSVLHIVFSVRDAIERTRLWALVTKTERRIHVTGVLLVFVMMAPTLAISDVWFVLFLVLWYVPISALIAMLQHEARRRQKN